MKKSPAKPQSSSRSPRALHAPDLASVAGGATSVEDALPPGSHQTNVGFKAL
jgi:hypothetical protein